MTLTIDVEQIPLKIDAGGIVRVGNTRVMLDVVVGAYNMGHGPEEIVKQYPSLQLADVYAAIGYYLRHRDAIDTYIERNVAEAERARKEFEEKFGAQPTREQLLTRRKSS